MLLFWNRKICKNISWHFWVSVIIFPDIFLKYKIFYKYFSFRTNFSFFYQKHMYVFDHSGSFDMQNKLKVCKTGFCRTGGGGSDRCGIVRNFLSLLLINKLTCIYFLKLFVMNVLGHIQKSSWVHHDNRNVYIYERIWLIFPSFFCILSPLCLPFWKYMRGGGRSSPFPPPPLQHPLHHF